METTKVRLYTKNQSVRPEVTTNGIVKRKTTDSLFHTTRCTRENISASRLLLHHHHNGDGFYILLSINYHKGKGRKNHDLGRKLMRLGKCANNRTKVHHMVEDIEEALCHQDCRS
jgi:hypothetical protein